MDALLSPQDDCFLTLAGMENERSRSLTPTPLPPSHSTESEVERVKKPLLKDPPVLMHEGRGGRGGVENWEETSGPNRYTKRRRKSYCARDTLNHLAPASNNDIFDVVKQGPKKGARAWFWQSLAFLFSAICPS